MKLKHRVYLLCSNASGWSAWMLRQGCMLCKKNVKGPGSPRRMRRLLAYLLLVPLFQVQTGQAETSDPPCSDQAFRDFDFWLGRWEVHTASGELAGHNEIQSAERGCVLTETWQGSRGGTGRSLNYYSPIEDRWHQLWVSPGVIIDVAGGLSDQGMVLTGTIP